MSKVKVSKELGKAIESALEYAENDENFLLVTHKLNGGWNHKELQPINKLSHYELAEILINGYVIEDSMEEKLAKLFEDTRKQTDWSDSNMRLYMKDALEIAGIEVPNDYWYDKL